MTALDHTTKRATRHELLRTARLLRERSRRLGRVSNDLANQAGQLEAEARGEDAIVLRGREITAALDSLVEVGETIHYKELEQRLLAAEKVAGGLDPAATLLAAIQRDPAYVRVGRGRYRRRRRRP